MRIVRFIDERGNVCFGNDPDPELATAYLMVGSLDPNDRNPTHERVKIVKLLAPFEPRAIMCIGQNYHEHAREMGAPIPQRPVLFMKNIASVSHPHDPIVIPRCSHGPEVDYEGELAVVIGRPARDVPVQNALDHVLGYTVGNDVSARWWQKKGAGGQFVRGKSFDTFCPLGPVLVSPDELTDPQSLRITTTLNGQVMQDAPTADMIFPVAELIAELSRDMTLLTGTVIMTGTPPGVGAGRDPQVFLKPGDTVTCAIDRIGALTNSVIDYETTDGVVT